RYRRTRSPSFQGRRATPVRSAPSRALASTSGEGSLVQRVRKVALHLHGVSGRGGGSRPPLAESVRHVQKRSSPGSRPSLAESVRNAGRRSSPGSRPSLAESVRNVGKLISPGSRPALAESVRNAGKRISPGESGPARQPSPKRSKRQPSNGREQARGPRVVLLPKAKVKPEKLAVPVKEGAGSQKKACTAGKAPQPQRMPLKLADSVPQGPFECLRQPFMQVPDSWNPGSMRPAPGRAICGSRIRV
ncbi:RMR3, partial [Symbiodinium sp. CCMP2456]